MESFLTENHHFKISLVFRVWSLIVLLLIIIIPLHFPNHIYILLRAFVFITCVHALYLSIIIHRKHKEQKFPQRGLKWNASFFIVAIIFNPIVPLQMSSDVWWLFDFLTILVFLFSTRHFPLDQLRQYSPRRIY